jgi:hypothetical protein
MPIRALAAFLVLVVGSLFQAAPAAGEPLKHPSEIPYAIRVLHVEGLDLTEAMTLLRRGIDVRRVVRLESRDALVVMDEPDRLSQAEALLKQNGATVGSTEPFRPLYLERRENGPLEKREFHVHDDAMDSVVNLLRTIYGVRELNRSDADHTVTASAPAANLDSAEAICRELRLLAGPPRGSGGR